jgi:hypothetical protein
LIEKKRKEAEEARKANPPRQARKPIEEETKRPEGRFLAPLNKVPGKKLTASRSPIRKNQSPDSLGRGAVNRRKQAEESKKAPTRVVTIKKQKEQKTNKPNNPPLDDKEHETLEEKVVEKKETHEVIEDKKVEDKQGVDVNPEIVQDEPNELANQIVEPEAKENQVNEKNGNKVEEIRKESVKEPKKEEDTDGLLNEHEDKEEDEVDIADVIYKKAEEALNKDDDPLEDVDITEVINKKV